MKIRSGLTVLGAIALTSCSANNGWGGSSDPEACKNNELAVQVLGSGGPIADDHRAGASNIVWIDGKARIMVDAGAGSFVRYGEAKVNFEDHYAILLTHFHGDHVGGLPALLNAGSFSKRAEPLIIAGPEKSEQFPSTSQLLADIVGRKGMLGYLWPYMNGSNELPELQPMDIRTDKEVLLAVLRKDGVEVDTVRTHHLEVPALAYVVRVKGKRIAFAGDQSQLSEDFVNQTRNGQPDVLIVHNAISMDDGQPRGLHRDGRSIGELAKAMGAKKLILTHHMQRALQDQDAIDAAIRENYDGPIEMADDLSCHPLI